MKPRKCRITKAFKQLLSVTSWVASNGVLSIVAANSSHVSSILDDASDPDFSSDDVVPPSSARSRGGVGFTIDIAVDNSIHPDGTPKAATVPAPIDPPKAVTEVVTSSVLLPADDATETVYEIINRSGAPSAPSTSKTEFSPVPDPPMVTQISAPQVSAPLAAPAQSATLEDANIVLRLVAPAGQVSTPSPESPSTPLVSQSSTFLTPTVSTAPMVSMTTVIAPSSNMSVTKSIQKMLPSNVVLVPPLQICSVRSPCGRSRNAAALVQTIRFPKFSGDTTTQPLLRTAFPVTHGHGTVVNWISTASLQHEFTERKHHRHRCSKKSKRHRPRHVRRRKQQPSHHRSQPHFITAPLKPSPYLGKKPDRPPPASHYRREETTTESNSVRSETFGPSILPSFRPG